MMCWTKNRINYMTQSENYFSKMYSPELDFKKANSSDINTPLLGPNC